MPHGPTRTRTFTRTRHVQALHMCVYWCSRRPPYVPAHAVKHRQQDYTRVSPVPDVLSRWPPVLPLALSPFHPAGARLATLSRGKLDETLRAAWRRPRESRFGKEVASPNRNPPKIHPKKSALFCLLSLSLSLFLSTSRFLFFLFFFFR